MVIATCALCGRESQPRVDGDPPLTWTADASATAHGKVRSWVCAECTRRHIRDIEAKLERDWW